MGRLSPNSLLNLSGVTPRQRLTYDRSPRDAQCATTHDPSRFTRLVGTLRRFFMPTKHTIARNLAVVFLSGMWSPEELLRRGAVACGRRERWLRPLIRRIVAAFDGPAGRTREDLASFIDADAGFNRAWERHREDTRFCPRDAFWGGTVPAMWPATGAPASWPLPALLTTMALANWLNLKPTELAWLADCHGHEADAPPGPLRHYTYRWLPKAFGKWRLLEMPKTRLKAIQRRILHELLDHIPPHDAAHGYRRGRSIATFAALHCGRRIVLRFDLRHFFASVQRSRIHALFSTVGYPSEVARALTGLCTNLVPADVWQTLPLGASRTPWEEQRRFRSPHLPQGRPPRRWPTSVPIDWIAGCLPWRNA